MIQSYHHERFEFFVSIVVIAIIALAALSHYLFMAEDSRILRMEILSRHFMTGAANARVQYLLETAANEELLEKHYLTPDGKAFHFSSQGWPISVSSMATDKYQPSEEDCYQLWMLLLQNPAPIAKGIQAKPTGEYRVLAQGDKCRYQYEDADAYFDYFPETGRLNFVANGR